jgi:transcriptional regulator with XRE-family HTH domain
MRHESRIKQFGKNLRKLRTEKGWSQEHFAELSGLHRTYIGAVERGERNPTIDVVFTISDALDCKISDLFLVENNARN